MFGKSTSTDVIPCVCPKCSKRYDLNQAFEVARQKNTRNVRCPKCQEKIGTAN